MTGLPQQTVVKKAHGAPGLFVILSTAAWKRGKDATD